MGEQIHKNLKLTECYENILKTTFYSSFLLSDLRGGWLGYKVSPLSTDPAEECKQSVSGLSVQKHLVSIPQLAVHILQ